MSIATLKRKTQVEYNNMSVGQKNFSLNGTHRSQGYVGQTMLSRSLPRSLMKGNVLKGYGGHNGEYKVMPVIQSAVISTEDINVLKSSVLNTQGMIDTKYRWINRSYPYTSVKPNTTNNKNSQGQYIDNLIKIAINIPVVKTPSTISIINKYKNYNMYYRKELCLYSKPESSYKPIKSGDYIRKIDNGCSLNNIYTIQNTMNLTPLPGN